MCSDVVDECHDPDHDPGPDPEEWVKGAEQWTVKESIKQATKEDHGQQAQKEPQANQHHVDESPQHEAQTVPPR